MSDTVGSLEADSTSEIGKLDAHIEEWMRELVDLSRRNRLLFFTPTRSSSLQLVEPSPTEVFQRLVIEEKPWIFFIPREEEQATPPRKPDELVCTAQAPIENIIKNLHRRSRTDFEERGVRILHLTFGMLQWKEMERGDTVRSPLILIPVELKRRSATAPFELNPVEEDAILNPALRVRLWKDFQVELPDLPDDWESEGIEGYLARVDGAVQSQGWSVSYECWVGLFSFYKLPIYEDLNRHRTILRQHPIIRALAGLGRITRGELPEVKKLDTTVKPSQSYLVLDADSSQLACIESIKKGNNLVIHGPPGTGKSQTIVNLIAECIAVGKTVLFVSEKMAALEVVYKRIRDRGLGHFCLELHSHKANKRLVVEELYKCYRERLEPKTTMAELEFQRLEERRRRLNEYVEALHRIQEPLRLTAYQVLGDLAELRSFLFVSPANLNPANLTPEQLDVAVQLARRLGQIWMVVVEGDRFPWRGCKADSYGMGIRTIFQEYINACSVALHEVQESGAKFAANLGLPPPASVNEAYWLLEIEELLRQSPAVPGVLLTKRDQDPFECLRSVETCDEKWPFIRITHEYDKRIIEEFDLDRLIKVYSSHFRWLHPIFFKSKKQIKHIRRGGKLPTDISRDLKLALELRKAIEWAASFHQHFRDRTIPRQIIEIAQSNKGVMPDPAMLKNASEGLQQAFTTLESQFEPGYPQLDGVSLRNLSFELIEKRLREMLERIDALRDWVDYRGLEKDFSAVGLGMFLKNLIKSSAEPRDLPNIVRRSLLQVWLDWLFGKEQALGQFRGQHHEQLIEEFRKLDRKHWELGGNRVILEVNNRSPRLVSYPGSEVHVLLREAHKKKRHLPIRKLFVQIPNLFTRIKPCLLMSPLTVSQFLDPAQITFDLVIFDEASQVRSEDAVGSIYRGRQIVVCGDNKQLPPTAFFDLAMSDEFDEDAEEPFDIFDSILDECIALGMPDGWLRWHYRSRHESLIAFSNRQFYDNRLVTFPSSVDEDPRLGIKFVYVPDGIYDRGGKRDNVREAEKVVELVANHFRQYPEKSLGIVAFSIAQANTIEDHIERFRKENQEFESFFTEDRLEGFFVKNLENVQGDERDVLIFSVGYAKDQQGRLTMHFGPVNKEGGERRLNVAVTRAREKVIVVSSIRASDLDLSATQAPGVLQFYKYLDYAERGREALDIGFPRLDEYGSPLEAEVAAEIRALGYEVVPQVGCSGYRIDMGVLDPARPGRFILGVECDGATYHSSYTARDRDRLRQEVLEKLGWRIHRVWAPDFVTRRDTEVRRLREAIEQARMPSITTQTETPKKEDEAFEPLVTKVNTPSPNNFGDFISWAIPYKACIPRMRFPRRLDFYDARAIGILTQMLQEVVNVEGPVHIEIAAQRLAQAWGLRRAGSRMMAAVHNACRYLVRSGGLKMHENFLWPVNITFQLKVRRPNPDQPATERSIQYIPQEEIELAFVNVLREALSSPRDALLTQVARIFGFERMSQQIQTSLEENLSQLIQHGRIVDKGGRLSVAADKNKLAEGSTREPNSTGKEVMRKRYCILCGNTIQEKDRYCCVCGRKVEDIENKGRSFDYKFSLKP